MENSNQFAISKKIYLIVVLLTTVIVVISSFLYYRIEADNVRREKYNELKAIAELKTNQIVEWRHNTYSQAVVISRSPVLRKTVEVFLKYPMYYRKDIIERLMLDVNNYKHENILMTDTSGRIILSAKGKSESLESAIFPSFREMLRTREIVYSDFYKCSMSETIHYDILAPLRNDKGRIVAVLIIRIDPDLYFYPLIQSWPTPSKTSETVLFRKSNDSIIFISNLRNFEEAALRLNIPLEKKVLPGVRASIDYRGIFNETDYRGVDVLSYIGQIPTTSWYMVSKIDEKELLSVLNYKAAIMILFTSLLLAFLWTLLGLVYNRRQRNIYSQLLEAEKQAQSVSLQRQLALDAANMGWWHYNPKDGSIWYDEQFQRIFGLQEELSADKLLSCIHPDDLPMVQAASKAALNPLNPIPYSVEYRVIHSDGSLHWVESHGTASFEDDSTGRRFPVKFVGTVQDTTERKQLEEGLRQRVEELETIMDVAPIAIWISDGPDCNNIRGNRMANEFYIAKRNENVSANVTDVRRFFRNGIELATEDLPMQQAAKKNIFIHNAEIDVLLPDGSWMTMIGSAYPLRDINGNVRGCIAGFIDLTEIRDAQKKLESTLTELQRSNRELEQFAYIASHDLQEPVRMIKVFTEMLKNKYPGSDEQINSYFRFISDGASRMHQLINALLEYSRLISSNSVFEPIDCNEVVKEVLTDLHFLIEEAGAKVSCEPLPVINGNRTMLRQLFQNLIQNAVKFRNVNPEIRVSHTKENGYYLIKVQDNGIGIAPEYYEKIFFIFQKLHSNDAYPGTGIGLASCKKIAELHGGGISVESVPGEGSTFCVKLPVLQDSNYLLTDNYNILNSTSR